MSEDKNNLPVVNIEDKKEAIQKIQTESTVKKNVDKVLDQKEISRRKFLQIIGLTSGGIALGALGANTSLINELTDTNSEKLEAEKDFNYVTGDSTHAPVDSGSTGSGTSPGTGSEYTLQEHEIEFENKSSEPVNYYIKVAESSVRAGSTTGSDVSFGSSGSSCEWTAPEGNQKYVSPDGGGSGTRENPWSVEQASQNASAGDVVNFLPGEYDEGLKPDNSGDPDNPIIFRSEEFHGAVIRDQNTFEDISDIVIEGFKLEDSVWIFIRRCERMTVKDNWMQDYYGDRTPFTMIDNQHVRIEGNFIRRTTKGEPMSPEDTEPIILEGNDMTRAGHGQFQTWRNPVEGLVVRGNVSHSTVGRNSFGTHGDDKILMENNLATKGFDGPGNAATPAKVGGHQNFIMRFNRWIDHWGRPAHASIRSSIPGDMENNRFYNNIFANNRPPNNPGEDSFGWGGLGINGYGNDGQVNNNRWENNVFADNYYSEIFLNNFDGGGLKVYNNFFHHPDRDAYIRQTYEYDDRLNIDEAEEEDSSTYKDNQEVNPGFVDVEKRDYYPASDSPMVGAGTHLTETSNGGSGTDIPVDDPHYFYDGFDIRGEEGDIIQVGDQTARITNVDRGDSLLTVDQSLSWNEGDPVGLPWSGQNPDIGIYETGTGRVNVRIVKSVHNAMVGDEIQLKAQLNGGKQIQEVRWYLGNGKIRCGDGSGISVSYDEPYDYGIRAKVQDNNGEIHWGVDLVLVSNDEINVDDIEYSRSEVDSILCSKDGYQGDERDHGYRPRCEPRREEIS